MQFNIKYRYKYDENFVAAGTTEKLTKAIEVYEILLRYFGKNQNNFTDRKYASALIDLTTAKAAILALEARLADQAGEVVDLAVAVQAYREARAKLAE